MATSGVYATAGPVYRIGFACGRFIVDGRFTGDSGINRTFAGKLAETDGGLGFCDCTNRD